VKNQHPLFIKYTRQWLHQVSGYSKGFLSRVATGKMPLTRSFIERVCYKLGLPEEELFSTGAQPAQCLGPWGCAASGIGQWLQERCQRERLSLREAAARTGLSHATISDTIKGSHPSAETMRKLAQAFGGDGHQRLALEDRLLVLAGYRTGRPREKLSKPLAQLMDKVRQFDEPRLKMMTRFADFLAEIEERK